MNEIKTYNFDEVVDRENTCSAKWEAWPENAPANTLPMWVADMDLVGSDAIIDATMNFAKKGVFGYATMNDAYKQTVVDWMKKSHDLEVTKESLCYSPGIVPAIAFLMQMLTKEGDGVVIQPPVYPPFSGKINSQKRTLVNNPLINTNGHYTINFEDFEEKMKRDDVKGFIFCNPHNPVGRLWTMDELQKLVAICKKYDKWIISDEIHGDLVRTGSKYIPTEKADPSYKNKIFTLYAPSKTFNIAGLQNSHVFLHDEKVREQWDGFVKAQLSIASPTPVSIIATIAAYTDTTGWLPQMLAYMDENARFIGEFLKENLPKAVYEIPEATYLAWIDLSAYISDPDELQKTLLEKGEVYLNSGATFGEEGKGFVRLNFGCTKAACKDALERIKKALV